ncbi:MAG: tetrahydrofolate synthase [Spirochaetaceae bacterium]|jgi:dihydrofolate synthase/folylpolyglutamate synthase|nr:tetrahydrofolate synthase [Spirochaetaceae bacterium]
MEQHNPPVNPVASSGDVFAWLSRFINLETGQFTTSLRLDRMEALSRLAGNPECAAPVIHVAGSKGKGSVTGMIASILAAHGLRPARYTSPHVTEYRERITLNNDFFPEQVYRDAGNALCRAEADLRLRGASLFPHPAPDDTEASFFELLTLYFFLCARSARCDVMVVETGLGGRLDATNIVDPLVSVITLIELEHTEFLGTSLGVVAGEKAGIIKDRRPLVLAEQDKEALAVFVAKAAEKNAPLRYLPRTADIEQVSVTKAGTSFTLLPKDGLFPEPLRLFLPIAGEIQGRNAALAAVAAKTAFPDVPAEAVARGLRDFSLPARFERILDAPVLIVDGAHTPHSVESCVKTFSGLYGNRGALLFGCAAGKDARTMARILLPYFSHIIITTPGTFKVSFPQAVYDLFTREAFGKADAPEVQYLEDTRAAMERALLLGREKGIPILGTGSFYLAAEIRSFMSPPPAVS